MRRIPTLAEVERKHIFTTLRLCGNNRTHAAKALGLSIRGLRIKLHQYEQDGFAVPRPRASDQIVRKQNSAGCEAA
jgi:two-component system response regulator FlrC